MVLCNPIPIISFTVKKTKIQIKIMWRNYLTIKNCIVQNKLQYDDLQNHGFKTFSSYYIVVAFYKVLI